MAIIQIRVKPNARKSHFAQDDSGQWQASLKARPVDGKANQELIALVADFFNCPKAGVSLKSGATGRMKLVEIADAYATLAAGGSR